MPERSFGRTIRYRRTKSGLSQAKLGELVGRSASTVRSWEQDTSTPTDPGVLDALAAVLALDPRLLYERAGLPMLEAETSPTVEQALASLRPPPRSESTGDDALPLMESEPDFAADFRDEIEDGSREPEAGRHSEPEPVGVPLASMETESVPPRTGPRFAGPPDPYVMTQPTPSVVEPSYIEDTTQRQLYRVRTLATVVLLVALVVVFVWALANTFDALGTWWDDFFGELNL
jgi:transcriptional regulator with XRE-family HTH domain